MSSSSDYQVTKSSPSPTDHETIEQPCPPPPGSSHTPMTPRKRRRLDSVDPSRSRNHYFEGRYNDDYRQLYNATVQSAAARIEPHDAVPLYKSQFGCSKWSSDEKAHFFAALERLGKDDAAGIAQVVATKSVPETRQLLLLLQDAAVKHKNLKVKYRNIPAAFEVSSQCEGHLDMLAEALAWYQEMYEASQEQARFGKYWLITTELASHIDDAMLFSRSRAGSSVPPSESEGRRRGGRQIPGACASCKRYKQRCDRETPCGNCVRRKLEPCVYPTPKRRWSVQPLIKPEPTNLSAPEVSLEKSEDDIMEAIPEARLLSAETMLRLSRNLFMNRSPSVSSPWPHWSEIKSDFTDEPGMFRSAFNDFHTLAVSVTKRLMQTAIMQATSRLRSQRHRTKKGAIPFVKRRDVLAAIDIVGMKRNGKQRWQGVARRCALRVVQAVPGRGIGKISKREVPWHKVEKILTPDAPFVESFATDTESSDHSSSSFKRRAARSGTPLPLGSLNLASSQEDSDSGGSDLEDSDDNSGVSTPADLSQAYARQPARPKDSSSRYPSGSPKTNQQSPVLDPQTIEEFDQLASREEERALREMLKLPAPTEDEQNVYREDDGDSDLKITEKVITNPEDWRLWIEYHAEWEEFGNPVPHAKFLTNMKSLPSFPDMADKTQHDLSMASPNSHSSSIESMKQCKRNIMESVELHTQNPQDYATHQGTSAEIAGGGDEDPGEESPGEKSPEEESSGEESSGEEEGSPIEPPIQSDTWANGSPQSQYEPMDWDAYMDL